METTQVKAMRMIAEATNGDRGYERYAVVQALLEGGRRVIAIDLNYAKAAEWAKFYPRGAVVSMADL